MQIKRSATVGCDTSFRCRSIWKNLPVTGSSGKREITFMGNSISQENTLNGRENYPSMEMNFFSGSAGFASFFGMKSFKIPCLNSALISSSVTSSPT